MVSTNNINMMNDIVRDGYINKIGMYDNIMSTSNSNKDTGSGSFNK